MKRNLLYLPIVLLALSSCASMYLNKADKMYEQEAYTDAAQLYEKSYDKKKSDEAIVKAIDSYLAVDNYRRAEKWLKKAIGMENADPKYHLELARVLVMNDKCEEGQAALAKYLELNPVAKEDPPHIGHCGEALDYNPDSTVYLVDPAGVNTRQSTFGATYYQNGIVFTSQRKNEDISKGTEPRTDMPYMNLYYSEIDDNNELGKPVSLGAVNKKFHQGPATFSPDGNVVIYAASRVKENGKMDKVDEVNFITLMVAEKVNGEWMNIRQLYPGNPSYSMSHPWLSPDGKTLYFSSDMPGGMGGKDIYKATFADGQWSAPENLGERVNTAGDEEFPTVWTNGEISRFYVASDALGNGFGGLDIYYFDMVNGKVSGKPHHLTSPINSRRDDFNFILAEDMNSGYLSSNRHQGDGVDYLYRVTRVMPEFVIEARLIDEITGEPIPNANVEVGNATDGSMENFNSDANGLVSFPAAAESDYEMTATANGYEPASAKVSTKGRMLSATIKKDVPMTSEAVAAMRQWENIYYDYNRSTIRKESKETLKTIASIMKEHPEVRIEMNGYADVRGDFMYNIELSKKRAEKAKDYLVKLGIDASRIEVNGLGETNILNHCKEGVECSDEEHQINRRTEFNAIR